METGYLQETWEMREVFRNRPWYFPLPFFKSLVSSAHITCRNYSTAGSTGNYSTIRVSLDLSQTGACGPHPLDGTCPVLFFLYVNEFQVHHDECVAPQLQHEHVRAIRIHSRSL